MATARSRDAWDRTAPLWAVLVNANRDPDKCPTPFSPADIHPYRDHDFYEPEPDPEIERDKQTRRRLAMLPPEQREKVEAALANRKP